VRYGVRELQLPGVQHQAALTPPTIDSIPDDGMADGAQVHPNLMGSSRQRAHLQQRRVGESCQDTKFGDGGLARVQDSHPLAVGGVAPDGTLNPPFIFNDSPPHKRQIELLDLSVLELLNQSKIRRVALGDEQDAAGALIQPVDDPRSLGRAKARQRAVTQ
jgi:hypothetical protein